MSADDDDQVDQQLHELADPGMAETSSLSSLLDTPWLQLCSRPRCGTRSQWRTARAPVMWS